MRLIIFLLSIFLVFCCFDVKSSNAVECLPTCNNADSKFLTVAGTSISTIAGAEIVINLVSNSGDNLEFGIFDGEAGGLWDLFESQNTATRLKYELHVDPSGNSSGLNNPSIVHWTSDGSNGLNAGSPMTDNGWSDFIIPNVPEAQAVDGSYIYTMRITPIDPMLGGFTENNFKIRTQDILYVPAMFPVTFVSNIFGSENPDDLLVMFGIIYPNSQVDIATGSVCGLPPGQFCDFNDPSCCLFETTYDGSWSFFMIVPEGEAELNIWDGDLDYGDFAGTVFDTDDPNTPGDPFLPEWSLGTDVVFETARPARPFDNNGNSSTEFFVRDPNITYFVIDPLGNSYQNFNPSGDREWELFRLSTQTDDPAVAEYMVDSIPAGLWEVRIEGDDISNLNSIVLPFDIRGVEEDSPEDPPTQVPTLNQWGLISLAFMGLLISILYLRRHPRVQLDS